MGQLERIAFMSYAHENDDLDDGYLTRFRERLEKDVTSLMGVEFKIFQDRRDVQPAHPWEERLHQYLVKSTILLPIVTPHFFRSKWCRKEFEFFRKREQASRYSQLILPIYYIPCKEMRESSSYAADSMEHQLPGYQYADWRLLRGIGINMPRTRRALTEVANRIVEIFNDLESDSGGSIFSIPPGGWPPPLHGGHGPRPDSSSDTNQLGLRGAKTETQAIGSAWKEAANRIASSFDLPFGDQASPFDLARLPRPRTVFGRSSDIDWVIEMLTTAPPPHIAALDGAAGIGKTAVAAEAVGRLYADNKFPGGIAVVRCTGKTDPRDVLRHTLTRFDPERRPPAGDDEASLAEEARRLLSSRQTLVVLDDIGINLEITHVIEPLSRAGTALLLTSKHPLAVAKARRRTLAPLQIEDALHLLTKPS